MPGTEQIKSDVGEYRGLPCNADKFTVVFQVGKHETIIYEVGSEVLSTLSRELLIDVSRFLENVPRGLAPDTRFQSLRRGDY